MKRNGIAPLVALLHSPNPTLRQTASAALRNLAFKNNDSKAEIQRCGGIASAVALLRETDSLEIQKQLTGRSRSLYCSLIPLSISHKAEILSDAAFTYQ